LAVVSSLADSSLNTEERRVIARPVPALIIAPGRSWENLGHAYHLLPQIADEEHVNPMRFALQVFDEDWLTGRRAIDSFFIREVDRDKIVLAGR
jgi:hypothetical protein